MTKRLFIVAATVLIACGLVGCSKSSLNLDSVELDGPGTLGLSVVGQPVKGVVVYFHGSDQNAGFIRDDEKHADFFDPLLRAGVAVVAADADGNAFGNPTSRQDYRSLMAAAQKKYGSERLYFVAESMGALPALALLSEDSGRQIKGMVGISPLMGIPASARSVNFIAGPWGGLVPDRGDPLAWSPQVFADRSFRLYASTDDEVIPADASAQAFANRFGSEATVDIIRCDGGHVAAACYQGDDVVKWFASLG
jgi:alpha-beta hydrolase superfamily lysophospholipase